MAMNPMQKKARTSFLLGMLVTLIIAGIIIGVLIYQLVDIKKQEEDKPKREVYVLTSDITSGDKVIGKYTKKIVESEYAPASAIVANVNKYINEESTSKIDLKKGEILTADMINEEGKKQTNDQRLQEYNMLVLPSQLEDKETVDIRLRLPSGEDYIVLSKKLVEQTDSETIWIKVSEDEILTMSNAIVEAYIMEGSLLYATTYLDAGLQESATPTYVASASVVTLMGKDPNIQTEARNALAVRYAATQDQRNQTINSALAGFNSTALTNVQKNVTQEIEKQKAARQEYVGDLNSTTSK